MGRSQLSTHDLQPKNCLQHNDALIGETHIPWHIKHFRASFSGPINCEDLIASSSALDYGSKKLSTIFVLMFFSSSFIAFSNTFRWVFLVAPNCVWKVFFLTAYTFRAFDFQKLNSKQKKWINILILTLWKSIRR